MAQTIVYPLNKFESLEAMNATAPVSHIELADQTISTTGTVFAAQNFGVAALRHVRCRVRVKSFAGACVPVLKLAVSTTSAMTSPEYVTSAQFTEAATTDIWDVDMRTFSVLGFQYAQLSALVTTTITMDVILEASP